MCSKFGIGENFGDWIDIIMKDRLACVKNNGLISSNFELQRGIRQGCALSPLLFIMAVELLAIKIRNDKVLQNLFIPSSGPIEMIRSLNLYLKELQLLLLT